MTPESLKQLFDGAGVMIIFAWGLLCKYVPFLRVVPNATIPWVGAILYILGKLAVGTASAQGADSVLAVESQVTNAGGVVIAGFTSAIWARQLWEGFARPLFEGWLFRILSKKQQPVPFQEVKE